VQYSLQGDIIIQGDFNAYTNTNPDFVISDDSPFPVSNDQHYVFDSPSPRNNMDKNSPTIVVNYSLTFVEKQAFRYLMVEQLEIFKGNILV
jgi:hypothetical protein